MTFEEFKAADEQTLQGLPLALWLDHQGDWERAHVVAQDIDGRDGAWVHGYLHRKEGDSSNAAYWYRRAGRPLPSVDLQTEWEAMVRELLSRGQS